MYSPQLVQIRVEQAEAALKGTLPHGLGEYTVDQVQEFNHGFKDLFDKKGNKTRPLTPREAAFVTNERILGKISWRYFAERYWTVNLAGQTIGPLFPLWESQQLILDQLAALEWERYQSGYPDGLIADVLKARQLGASTLVESFIGHRLTTHAHVNGLLASDVPDNSNFLYDMFERGVDYLPWYMLPTITERVKNDEMVFGTGSRLMMGASKSTRGAEKTDSGGGRKGQLGRGKTVSIIHLSELATWVNPQQINTSLDPGIPVSPQTLWIKESTAQGRGPHNWWYMDWQQAKSGRSRTTAIFIPWYAERGKYRLPYPAGWIPTDDTIKHARRIEETSSRWMRGKVYRPTKEQLFWYERTKADYTMRDMLEDFLQEYPADDEDAFQLSGRSVFKVLVRERVRTQARPLLGMIDVQSRRFMGMA